MKYGGPESRRTRPLGRKKHPEADELLDLLVAKVEALEPVTMVGLATLLNWRMHVITETVDTGIRLGALIKTKEGICLKEQEE